MRSAKKSTAALKEFFWNETINMIQLPGCGQEQGSSLAFVLMVLLAQLRTKFLRENEFKLKALSMLFDNITQSLIQFTRFLHFYSDATYPYTALLPQNSLELLIIE